MKYYIFVIAGILLVLLIESSFVFYVETEEDHDKKDTLVQMIQTNVNGQGLELSIEFRKGKKHSHPLFAIWTENMNENYNMTLYVSKSIATGIFEHGDASSGKWMPGNQRRPAALPYWSHKRGVKEKDGLYVPTSETAIPDAYSGATPQGNFRLETKTDRQQNDPFRILLEINQSFDWNDYWTNNKYPDDHEYKTSSQPAVVYAVTVNPGEKNETFYMHPIGHSHYSGKDGTLNTDLSTLTTALQIVEKIGVIVK